MFWILTLECFQSWSEQGEDATDCVEGGHLDPWERGEGPIGMVFLRACSLLSKKKHGTVMKIKTFAGPLWQNKVTKQLLFENPVRGASSQVEICLTFPVHASYWQGQGSIPFLPTQCNPSLHNLTFTLKKGAACST